VAKVAVRWSEVAGALLTFLVLVALPLAAIRLIPAQTLDQLTATGLDIPSLATQTALFGLVISAIALVKAMIARTSIAYFLLDVSSNLVSLVFALLIVGMGNIGSLGYSSFKFTQGKVTTEILMDLRVFIWLTVGVVSLSVLQSVAKFREARAEEAARNTVKPA
jgi:hypothetical protein